MRNGIVNLSDLNAQDLEPLLTRQTIEWQEKLDWDFHKSANLVRKLADARTLSGAALFNQGKIESYAYAGLDGHKGLLAEVYPESILFSALLEALIQTKGVQRIEGQLMLRQTPPPGVTTYQRQLMILTPEGHAAISRVRLQPWNGQSVQGAAEVVAKAYAGHIDSKINDHYRTGTGAAAYLQNIEHYPGSATFHPPASFVAYGADNNPEGIVLSSFIASEVAHIAEICVTPESRGRGLGRELLNQAIAALRLAGAKRISLAVTTANKDAIRLYTKQGFLKQRRFYAFVWEAPSRSSTTRKNDSASA